MTQPASSADLFNPANTRPAKVGERLTGLAGRLGARSPVPSTDDPDRAVMDDEPDEDKTQTQTDGGEDGGDDPAHDRGDQDNEPPAATFARDGQRRGVDGGQRRRPRAGAPAVTAPARQQSSHGRTSDTAQLSKVQVVVYLPHPLRAAAEARKRSERTSWQDLVMDAVDAAHTSGQLQQVWQYREGQSSLFNRRPSRRAVPTAISAAAEAAGAETGYRTTIQFLMDADNRAVLDELVGELHAPDRSALVASALSLHLDDRF